MTTISGTSTSDNLSGGSGNDILDGGAGDDKLSGGAGSDILYGGSGNDRLVGGAGSDLLDGGSGSDILNGDSGNDTLTYVLGENRGSTDLYTGGSGIDTIRLVLTQTEWFDDAVQAQLARYFQHLATVKQNATTGEVSNGSSRDFTFTFANSTTLTVSMMEKLEVWVDGQPVSLDTPVIDSRESTSRSSGGKGSRRPRSWRSRQHQSDHRRGRQGRAPDHPGHKVGRDRHPTLPPVRTPGGAAGARWQAQTRRQERTRSSPT